MGMNQRRAVLIVDHGSRFESANQLVVDVAERIRLRRPEWIVESAHMEIADPSIAAGIAACVAAGAHQIDLHPYFLGTGRHITESIPALVEAALIQHPDVEVRITPPLGLHSKIVDVVLERIQLPGED